MADPPSNNESECINWNLYYSDCTPGEHNPFSGAISFDNIGLAWVAIFLVNPYLLKKLKAVKATSSLCQVISLEGWTDVMYFVQDAHSFWNWLYFVLLIVVREFC